MNRIKFILIVVTMGCCSNQISISEFYKQLEEYQYCDSDDDCAMFCRSYIKCAYNKDEYENVQDLFERIDYGEKDINILPEISKANCNEQTNLCESETICEYSDCDAETDYDNSSDRYCCTVSNCPE